MRWLTHAASCIWCRTPAAATPSFPFEFPRPQAHVVPSPGTKHGIRLIRVQLMMMRGRRGKGRGRRRRRPLFIDHMLASPALKLHIKGKEGREGDNLLPVVAQKRKGRKSPSSTFGKGGHRVAKQSTIGKRFSLQYASKYWPPCTGALYFRGTCFQRLPSLSSSRRGGERDFCFLS